MSIRALPLYATLAIFLLAYLICYIQFPAMLSTRVIGNLLTDNAYLGIVAVGMTVVIVSGGIDLSVGSVIAFAGVFIAVVLRETGMHPLVVFAMLLMITTAFGAAMGGDDLPSGHAAVYRDPCGHVSGAWCRLHAVD